MCYTVYIVSIVWLFVTDLNKAITPVAQVSEHTLKVDTKVMLVKGNDTLSSPTVEDRKDIDEKIVLKSMLESAMLYLQRSLSILIKSVISRLCGTKPTLKKLHEITSKLQNLPVGSSEKSQLEVRFAELVNASCKFWSNDCSEAEDWVWQCRKVLPRKTNDPQQEWKDLTEDLKSWKLDTCLKFINRAGYKIVGNSKCKLVCRLEHDRAHLFSSKYICFKTDSYEAYKFVELAEKATEVRNYYAHLSTFADIIEKYPQHFKIIEEFATMVLNWVETEDEDSRHVLISQENVQCIKQKQRCYLLKHTAKWDTVLDGLKNLNFNEFGYVLVSMPCNNRAGVAITKEELGQLSKIPWAAVVDFDVASRQDGLLNSLCEIEGGQHMLKDCQSASKNTVVPFTYSDISEAERGELCRDGRIPWIFPHGELQDQSNKTCPLSNHQQYRLVVRKPLSGSMRKIISHNTQNSLQGTVSVVLCYGDYGYKSESLPYDNFFSDLKYLCNMLSDEGGHIIILSDCLFLKEHLHPLPVFIFPLVLFCQIIKRKLTFGQDKIPSFNMPSSTGPRCITFDEEDFELVHEHIATHEFYKHKVQKIIELRQKSENLSETKVEISIQKELRENFYKGQTVTWISLEADHAIVRKEEHKITSSIRQMLFDRDGDKIDPAKYVIYHSIGAGATTLARKILWNLRNDFPCVILKSTYKHSDGRVKGTSLALKTLYEELQKPILMLIDEEPSFKTIPCLTSHVQANGTPMVFLQVQRFDPSSNEQEMKGVKDSIILPSALHPDDANRLKKKLYIAFGDERGFAGDRNVAEMESSVVTPSQGDQVTDLVRNGIITELDHKQNNLDDYYLVKVIWEDSNEEKCIIGSFRGKINSDRYRSVYLNAEISQVYGTFYFYGIMYLDEEFRGTMFKHIQRCLNAMLSSKTAEDDRFKQQLLILAYLSILFHFKVCESIHIKAFEHLCYSITKSCRTEAFKLQAFIPKAALEFMIITRKGQFRIIHPIVAHEIIKFYLSKKLGLDHLKIYFPPSFVCDFLKYMLPLDKEFQNQEATLAINRLLRYREYENDETGYLTKKPFSELILTLDRKNPQHAVEVLNYSCELINICHSYGHYARYMSKKMHDYDRALEILREAEKLAFQRYEEGLVLNIKGDVYREKLHKYLNQAENLEWKDNKNKAFEFHFHACEAYQESYEKHPDDFPLFNELVVRLDLLETIKKSLKLNEQKFVHFIHAKIPDPEVAKSITTCLQLVKDLNEYFCTEGGGRHLDSCSDEAHIKALENRLLSVIGLYQKKRKEILYDLMTNPKYAAHVNLPYVRRSFIHLSKLNSNPSLTDLDICLKHLEKNFSSVGHVDRDMINWLLIIRGMSYIGGNTKTVEEKLISWKNQGPCLISDNRNIQAKNNPIWVNFYLTICYFVQLTETEDEEEAPLIVKKYNDAYQEIKQLSKNGTPQNKIKEWLHNNGTGFGRLQSGQVIPSEMLQLTGSVGIPSWQEARLSRGDKGFPYVSWKSLRIPFNAKFYSSYQLKQGQPVTFGVGFTFTGPRATLFVDSGSSVPNSPNKISSKDGKQQPVQACVSGSSERRTYSQVAMDSQKTVAAPEHKPSTKQPSKKKSKKKKLPQ